MNETIAVVMAAGKGTRMESDLPKVLVPACGRPLVEYVLDALEAAGVGRALVVVGYRADDVRAALSHRQGIEFIDQTEQLGTGHAVKMCVPQLQGHEGAVLVLTGDSPLTQAQSLRTLLGHYQQDRPACILGTLKKADPHGLGRIVRDTQGDFLGIVEEKDASPAQRQIQEVNMSTYVFHGPALLAALEKLSNNNRQSEYYITDCPGILKAEGKEVRALPVLQECEALSVNNLADLAIVEAEIERRRMLS